MKRQRSFFEPVYEPIRILTWHGRATGSQHSRLYLPKALNFPSYLPFRAGIVIFSVEPSRVIMVAIGADGWLTV
jgi:hypothetical protein